MEERDLEASGELDREQQREQAEDKAPVEPTAEQEEAAANEVTALLEQLEEAKKNEAEYLDGWQRARAELANARKRFQREQEQAYSSARADVLVRLLPIVDDFERAFATLPEEVEEEPWLNGMRLIWRKFQALLQQEGVSAIEANGQEFDPYLHQAVTHEPSETVPEGHIIDEMQKGYQVNGRVLRPSIVRVSSGQLQEASAPEAVAPEAGAPEAAAPEAAAPEAAAPEVEDGAEEKEAG